MNKPKQMQRVDFITKLGRLFLVCALATTAVLLGRRATTDKAACNTCPGKGVCTDFSDCSTFLSEKKDESKTV
jgi:hypothetical protein